MKELPQVDQHDLQRLQESTPYRRQFAPVYAHKAYIHALTQESAVGDYTTIMQIGSKTRQKLVQMIQGIHTVKKYGEETFFLALSLADRYLILTTLVS